MCTAPESRTAAHATFTPTRWSIFDAVDVIVVPTLVDREEDDCQEDDKHRADVVHWRRNTVFGLRLDISICLAAACRSCFCSSASPWLQRHAKSAQVAYDHVYV